MAVDQATDGDMIIESNHESSEQIQLAFAEPTGEAETSSDPTPIAAKTSTEPSSASSADAIPPSALAAVQDTASSESPQGVETATDVTEDTKVPERLRKKSSTAAVQSAIAKQREAEYRAQTAEAKLAQLSQPPPADTGQADSTRKADWARYKAMPGSPKVADFEDYEDYAIALTTFVTDVRQHERTLLTAQETQQRAFTEAQEARAHIWQTRLLEARSKDPNFDATLDPNTPMSLPMQHLAMESPVGTALLQYLSSHQEDSQRLSTLHPVEVYREMGRLEERLSAAPSSTSGSVRVDVSHAKPPIKPLGTSPHAPDPHEITDDMAFEEHFRRMNAADRKRGLL
jgi:hypothetical protein